MILVQITIAKASERKNKPHQTHYMNLTLPEKLLIWFFVWGFFKSITKSLLPLITPAFQYDFSGKIGFNLAYTILSIDLSYQKGSSPNSLYWRLSGFQSLNHTKKYLSHTKLILAIIKQ